MPTSTSTIDGILREDYLPRRKKRMAKKPAFDRASDKVPGILKTNGKDHGRLSAWADRDTYRDTHRKKKRPRRGTQMES